MKHNSKILERFDFDFDAALEANSSGTNLIYGSEFRPVYEFEPLLQTHELWPRTKAMLANGVQIPPESMNPQEEKENLHLGIICGNHKGAVS